MSGHDRIGTTSPTLEVLEPAGPNYTGPAVDLRDHHFLMLQCVYQGAGESFDIWADESPDGVTWTEIAGSRKSIVAGALADWSVHWVDRGKYGYQLRARASSGAPFPAMSLAWVQSEATTVDAPTFISTGTAPLESQAGEPGPGSFRRVDNPEGAAGEGLTTTGEITTDCAIRLPGGEKILLPGGEAICLPGSGGAPVVDVITAGEPGASGSVSTGDLPTKYDATSTGSRLPQGGMVDWFATGGKVNIKTSGVISNTYFSGQVNIQANDVEFEDCIFDVPGSTYAIHHRQQDDAYTGLKVRYCELKHATSAAVLCHEGHFSYVNIHDTGADGIKAKSYAPGELVYVEKSYLHRLGNETYAANPLDIHADGGQTREDDGGAQVWYEVNFDIWGHGALYHPNACFIIQAKEGSITGSVRIERCYLNGGNNVVYMTSVGHPLTENWALVSNVWGNDWTSGPIKYDGPAGQITGNIREDTGANIDGNLVTQTPWS